jgi:hypothetical protein
MEVALRQRLEGADDVSISQGQQTAEVRFVPAARSFQPRLFREATKEAGVEVLRFEVDACGTLEQRDGARLLIAGDSQFTVTGGEAAPVGQPVCVSGRLEDQGDRMSLAIATVLQPAGN